MNHPPCFLVSTQSYRHEKDTSQEIPTQYGYLVETDFAGHQRKLAIPTPTESSTEERIKPGLRGVARWRDRIYAAAWNAITIVDARTFEIVDTFSHPLMADLHGLHVDDEGLVVTSSLVDCVLFFDSKWNLERVRAFSDTSYYPKHKRKEFDTSQDYRYRGKTFRGFREYHANHVTKLNSRKFLVTGRGRKKGCGHVVVVDRKTGRFRTWIDKLNGPHDGVFVEPDLYAVTETDTSTVALIRDRGLRGRKVERRLSLPEMEEKFWTRGLGVGPQGHLYIGQSVWSGAEGTAYVVEMTSEGEVLTRHPLDLPEDYTECRIFQILYAPSSDTGTQG